MNERAEVKISRMHGLKKSEKSVFLVGMRGSGKTTVGRLLAEQTGRRFIDFDKLLEERMEMSTQNIVAQHGWDYFREREAEVVQAVSNQPRVVGATGGGAILRPSNREALKKGLVLYLDTPVSVSCDRIGDDPNRPPLTDKGSLEEELAKVSEDRSGIYEYVSDMAFGTERHTPQTLTKTIFHHLRRERYI